jgi:hypothetical protein
MTGPRQPHLACPLRLCMNPPMTPITQPRQIRQPMRIRPTTPSNVMHTLHRTLPAALTQPTLTLPHLNPTGRIHRITLPTPVTHGLHSSSAIARLNSSKSASTMSATSRIDRDVPPASSQRTNIGTSSSGHRAFDCLPHTAHHQTMRHGRRSNRVRCNGTAACTPQF